MPTSAHALQLQKASIALRQRELEAAWRQNEVIWVMLGAIGAAGTICSEAL